MMKQTKNNKVSSDLRVEIIQKPNNLRCCSCCEKDITIQEDRIGNNTHKHSNEGVLFDKQNWLCNECWNECLQYFFSKREIQTEQIRIMGVSR